MIQVIRRPGGAWQRNADGSRGAQLWRNVRGNRTLTRHGENVLQNFQDLTVHIPCTEGGYDNDDHPTTRDRDVWYPVSENSLPGMLAELQQHVPIAYINQLENLARLPPSLQELGHAPA